MKILQILWADLFYDHNQNSSLSGHTISGPVWEGVLRSITLTVIKYIKDLFK
jgi:hypothetical protein